MNHSVACYRSPRKKNARALTDLFAAGCGGETIDDLRYRPRRPAAFYGLSHDTIALYREAAAASQDLYYIDHPYFRRGEYYRVTRNGLQHGGMGAPDFDRLHALGVEIAPWRCSGNHILVCPQSELWHEFIVGEAQRRWVARITGELRRHTDREIVVRYKPKIATATVAEAAVEARRQLADAFEDCWAVVAYNSNVAVEAVIAGVPAFVLGPSAAQPVASTDLSLIETPRYAHDRDNWAAVLAANQWSEQEIADGACWRTLQGTRGTG